ncbi:MAG TPA: hypothetical protein VK927_04430, partial [Adhaeribacter sp.]|nr:hypothetical protein [Adhaeribacter sp.]
MRFPQELTEPLLAALSAVRNGLGLLLPEIILTAAFLLLLLLGLFRNRTLHKSLPFVAAFTFLLTFLLQVPGVSTEPVTWMDLLRFDGLARYAAMLFSAAGFLTVLHSVFYKPFKTETSGQSEYYALLVFVVLGLNLMAKSVNLLFLFLAIETVSIGSYVLTLR